MNETISRQRKVTEIFDLSHAKFSNIKESYQGKVKVQVLFSDLAKGRKTAKHLGIFKRDKKK